MAEHDYLNQFTVKIHGARSLGKALAVCALLGGIYGATVGSAIGAVPGATGIIEIAAGVMALIFGVPGARIGSFIGIVTQNRFGKLFLTLFAAIAGALLGGFFATVLLLAFGALLGAVGGWLLATGIIALRHDVLRRFLFGIAGGIIGIFAGAILWAVNLHQNAALAGAACGAGIGAVVGPLVLLMVVGALNSITKIRANQRTDYIDARFQPEDHDERPTSLPDQR
jgi:hypothetical protein